MRFSSRIPQELAPNAWAARLAALRASGADLVDLTEANPIRTGLALESPLRLGSGPAPPSPEPFDARGAPSARAAIAAYYASRGFAADGESIVLTASTSEAYAHLFRMLADPGEAILVPRPSYPLFVPLARAEGVAVQTYTAAGHDGIDVNVEELANLIGPRTRAIVVVQPNHPTGSCFDANGVAALDALAERHGLAIIADEVFGDYPWPAEFGRGVRDRGTATATPTPTPCGLESFVGDRQSPTFVMSGLSKVCGLPQMKGAWIVTSGQGGVRARAMERLTWLADLFLSVSSPTQSAIPDWLAGRHDFQQRTRDRICMNLGQLAAASDAGASHTLQRADGGWVAVLRLPQRRTDEEWALELLDAGVVVHPGHFYDCDVESLIVVSLIVEPGEFSRGLERIEALIARR